MAGKARVRRYRAWYARLLRLDPPPFRGRFGEGMAQTFHDLHPDKRSGHRQRTSPKGFNSGQERNHYSDKDPEQLSPLFRDHRYFLCCIAIYLRMA
jgi:hypothetical protein